MTPTLTRNDAAAPNRVPGARAWTFEHGRRTGIVAGPSDGRWAAAWVSPLRAAPFAGMVTAGTRTEAVARLVEGVRG